MTVIKVAAAVIVKNRKILIAKKNSSSHIAGKWEFPGGKIEKDETPQQCLVREIEEELGILIQTGNFITVSHFDYGIKQIELLAYFATHITGEITLFDHEEVKWIDCLELPLFDMAPADIPIVEKLLEIYLNDQQK